ncbi:MAG: methanogenesis marker protein Mmp4/MtxX [Methanobacteriaceae archaeon]
MIENNNYKNKNSADELNNTADINNNNNNTTNNNNNTNTNNSNINNKNNNTNTNDNNNDNANNIVISIGIGENKSIEQAINEFKSNISINKNDITIKKIESNEEFLEEVKNKSSDAYIRGSLSASTTIKYLKDIYNTDTDLDNPHNTIARASLIKNNNINNYKNNNFLLAPVGIDEGNTVAEKLEIAINACEFLIKNGKTPKIAIISGGRQDDAGRGQNINEMLENSEKLYNDIKNYLANSNNSNINNNNNNNNSNNKTNNTNEINKGTVKNYYILIEEAINDNCNLIIAPNGIIGNIIFRSLVLISDWKSYGGITLGINEIFIDTSRSQTKEGYLRAIEFAYKLAKKRAL